MGELLRPHVKTEYFGAIGYNANDRVQSKSINLGNKVERLKCKLTANFKAPAGGDPASGAIAQEGALALIRSAYVTLNNGERRYALDGRGIYMEEIDHNGVAPVMTGGADGQGALAYNNTSVAIYFDLDFTRPGYVQGAEVFLDATREYDGSLQAVDVVIEWGDANDVFPENAGDLGITDCKVDMYYDLRETLQAVSPRPDKIVRRQMIETHVGAGVIDLELPRIRGSRILEIRMIQQKGGVAVPFDRIDDEITLEHGTDNVFKRKRIGDIIRDQKVARGPDVPDNIILFPMTVYRNMLTALDNEALEEELVLRVPVNNLTGDDRDVDHKLYVYVDYITTPDLN